ncbi:MAG TPA: RNA polymerase sigma factor [Terriglobia bacterium]|nr:RNA polymerase sigma factor [Terriglobia bacterium]
MEDDPKLVQRCLAGENSAWEDLLKLHTRKIFNLCYRFTGRPSEAEDLTQEIFIKIFQTLRSYDVAQGTFATWLSRVARNHLVDHYRRTKKDRITSSLDEEEGAIERTPSLTAGPGAQVESRERKELLQMGLDKLSPDLREAVILRDLNDLDYDEIARVLGVPQGTVKSRINRGRLELARVLKRMEGMRGPATAGGKA